MKGGVITMRRYGWLDKVAFIVAAIGAINWGLIGLFGFNLVDAIFGATFSDIIYTIVGLAGLYLLYRAIAMPAEEATDERAMAGRRGEVFGERRDEDDERRY